MENNEYNADNDLFVVECDGKYGFTRATGEEISPPIFDYYHMCLGFAIVRKGNLMGNLFFHENLKEPYRYRAVEVYEVRKGNKYGIESDSGEEILPCVYDFVKIYDTIAVCKSGDSYYILNIKLKEFVGDRPYEDIDLSIFFDYHHHNRLNSDFRKSTLDKGICVKIDGKWGIISQKGKWLIKPIAEEAKNIEILQHTKIYREKYYLVIANEKKGLIDEYGNEIIPIIYDEIKIDNGRIIDRSRAFIVTLNNKYGLYNKWGKILLPCEYNYIDYLTDDVYLVSDEHEDIIWNYEKTINIDFYQPEELNCYDVDIYSLHSEIFSAIASSLYNEGLFVCSFDIPENYIDYNTENALKWHLFSVEFKGISGSISLTALYKMFKYGIGVKRDEKRAKFFLNKMDQWQQDIVSNT